MYSEPTVTKEIIFEGKIITLEHHTVKTEKGIAKREIVLHVPGVAILCRTPDDKIFFVRQYRKPFEEEILEIPAGKTDEGEDILESAKRELREETGFMAKTWRYLGEFLASPGFTNETVYLYEASDIEWNPLKGDDDEFITVEKYTEEEVRSLVKEGRISDGKTLAALFMSENEKWTKK